MCIGPSLDPFPSRQNLVISTTPIDISSNGTYLTAGTYKAFLAYSSSNIWYWMDSNTVSCTTTSQHIEGPNVITFTVGQQSCNYNINKGSINIDNNILNTNLLSNVSYINPADILTIASKNN